MSLRALHSIAVSHSLSLSVTGEPSKGDVPGGQNSSVNIFQMMSRMTATLHLVVGDLVPLFPADYGLLILYQDRAYEKIRDDITTFYMTNRQQLSKQDLLQLLSFMNHQATLLSRYSGSHVDVGLYTDLGQDILRQLTTVIQTAFKAAMVKCIQSDDKTPPIVEPTVGVVTSWCLLLFKELGDILAAMRKGDLNPASKEALIVAILDVLEGRRVPPSPCAVC